MKLRLFHEKIGWVFEELSSFYNVSFKILLKDEIKRIRVREIDVLPRAVNFCAAASMITRTINGHHVTDMLQSSGQ